MTTSLGKLRSTSIGGGKPGKGLLALAPWRAVARSAVVGVWLLLTGNWNDAGTWDDAASWKDS